MELSFSPKQPLAASAVDNEFKTKKEQSSKGMNLFIGFVQSCEDRVGGRREAAMGVHAGGFYPHSSQIVAG